MKRFFYLLMLAGFVGCTPVASSPDIPHAAIAPACEITWADYRAELPAGLPVSEIPDVEAFLKAFNASPPQSNDTADEIYAFPYKHAAMIVLVTDGCVTVSYVVNAATFMQLPGTGI